MPTPKADETESDFVERCIPVVLDEGTAEDGTQAAAICHNLFRKHKDKMTAKHDFLLDNFVITKPGEPYRLFPFGQIWKNGVARDFSVDYLRSFHLPHFKPPIKLGSHADEAPAGGHIIGIDVRDDGLYAIPEFNPKGLEALENGAYRYHSPEVIWEDEALEDPQTGNLNPGPMILGDALLHTPHLGEAVALYTVEPVKKQEGSQYMADEVVSVPKTLWEKFMAKVFPEAEEPPAPAPIPEELKAAVVERDALKAEKTAREAEAARVTLMAAVAKEFAVKPEEFGMAYIELGKAEESAAMLAGMTEEQRAWCLRNFKALSKQIVEAGLIGEHGSEGRGTDANPTAAFDAAVHARMKEKAIGYVEAYNILKVEQADLFKSAFERKPKD